MKTTADLIVSGKFLYSVKYMGEKISISNHLRRIVEKHYYYFSRALDSTSEEISTEPFRFYHKNNFNEKIIVGAHISLRYTQGIISIFIVHDRVQCVECEGRGYVRGVCSECGQDADIECEECYGSGLDYDFDKSSINDTGLEKEVLYKVLDLNQGELEFA